MSPNSQKHFAKYQAWLGSLGAAALKPMLPFNNIHTINPDGSVVEGSSVAMNDHTIIQAESVEQAIEYANFALSWGLTLHLSSLSLFRCKK